MPGPSRLPDAERIAPWLDPDTLEPNPRKDELAAVLLDLRVERNPAAAPKVEYSQLGSIPGKREINIDCDFYLLFA